MAVFNHNASRGNQNEWSQHIQDFQPKKTIFLHLHITLIRMDFGKHCGLASCKNLGSLMLSVYIIDALMLFDAYKLLLYIIRLFAISMSFL
jgi:hypothetical protein